MIRLIRALRPRRPNVVNQYGDALNLWAAPLWEPTHTRTNTPKRTKP